VYSVVLSRSDLMKRVILLVARVAVCGVLFFCVAFSGTVSARAAEQAFVSRSAEIDGVKLRYTTGGHGPSVILLHGYAETSRMWTPILPVLGEKFTVIAPDLPGVGEWGTVYNNPAIWHFRFNRPTPEALVHGRERLYFEYFWNDLAADRTRSLPEADRKAYAEAYARPGRMRAGWSYFVSFQQAAKDFAQLSQTKLTMPVLAIGGDKSLGEFLGQQMKLVASALSSGVLKNTGQW